MGFILLNLTSKALKFLKIPSNITKCNSFEQNRSKSTDSDQIRWSLCCEISGIRKSLNFFLGINKEFNRKKNIDIEFIPFASDNCISGIMTSRTLRSSGLNVIKLLFSFYNRFFLKGVFSTRLKTGLLYCA